MGIIIKQTIRGTIWIYFGVILGFFTTTYFYPNYLTPEMVGLIGLLISYSDLSGRIFLLGLPSVVNRLFPHFRNSENGHNGFIFISIVFHVIGFVLFLLLFSYVSPKLIESNAEKSALFAEYVYLIIPLTLSAMLFIFFDIYSKVLYNAVLGTFLQDFLQKLMLLTVVMLYAYKVINIEQFVVSFVFVVSLKAVLFAIYLLKQGELNFKPQNKLFRKLKREIISVALYGLIGSFGSIIIFSLDKIIINEMLDLASTGVYTIAVYFGALIAKPSKPLLKISSTLIAEAWKKNNLKEIKDIYYKSCLNQLIIGAFLFLGIWANIDNILIILGEDYIEAKWVIFFISLGYLIDMTTGANAHVISLSKYYKVSLIFILILLVLVVLAMYILIPLWGIVGAAVAISGSLFLNNLMRFVFLYVKFRLQPFNYKFILIASIYIAIYFLLKLIPQQVLILDIVIRGSVITICSFFAFWLLPLSEDIQTILNKSLDRIGQQVKKRK